MASKTYSNLFDAGDSPAHPRIRRWQTLKEKAYLFDLEIHRKWDGLTFSPAKMFLTLKKDPSDPGNIEEFLWEEELNQGLVDLTIPAVSKENEAVRYALAFRSAFEQVSLRHGQDYMRSVLIVFLRHSDIAKKPRLKKVLAAVHVDHAYRGQSYEQALESIEAIIKGKANELTKKLGYSKEAAGEILVNAIAQYVEEIFHLTARRAWASK